MRRQMNKSDRGSEAETSESAKTSVAHSTSASGSTEDANHCSRNTGVSSSSNRIVTESQGSTVNQCVELLLFGFGISGLIIFCSTTFYILTSTYWEQHDFIRKAVRITSNFSQFCVFTIISCITKRGLYHADEDRISDRLWRRLKSAVYPIIPSRTTGLFLTKIEKQNLTDDQLKKCRDTKSSHVWQKHWPYALVVTLSLGIVGFSLLLSYISLTYYRQKKPNEDVSQRDIHCRLLTEYTTMVYHVLSLMIVLPTFCEIIHIYMNRMEECYLLEEEFLKVPINWQNQAVMKLSDLKDLLALFQNGAVHYRTLANRFSSFYILNMIIYSAAYAFYLTIHKRISEFYTWCLLGLLLTSALVLLIFMLCTNWSGNILKKQAAQIYCVNDCEDENNAEPVERDATNYSNLSKAGPLARIRGWKNIVDQFDSYAVFFIFSSIPAQALAYITGLVGPWVIVPILKTHGYAILVSKHHGN